jgi:nitroimidazol reductase NimA-like FMN-containing flavoprotein (pyridoxamine 5'-phosphate oxidase superfamily)
VNRETEDARDPSAIDLVSQMGVMDEDQCIELLSSTPIGRVGFNADGAPLVLPVNFAWYENTIVFRTLEGQKLAAAAGGQTVCFEVDSWDGVKRSGWSVLVKGVAREVTNWAEQEQLENIGLVPWARDQWRKIWVRIEPSEITGRFVS